MIKSLEDERLNDLAMPVSILLAPESELFEMDSPYSAYIARTETGDVFVDYPRQLWGRAPHMQRWLYERGVHKAPPSEDAVVAYESWHEAKRIIDEDLGSRSLKQLVGNAITTE
jgi:hypothetical protein